MINTTRSKRHFRYRASKIIVCRNEAENSLLSRLKTSGDYCFEAQDTGSPITLLQGPKTKKAIEKAALLTAYYSDKKQGSVSIKYGKKEMSESLRVLAPNQQDAEKDLYRLSGSLSKSNQPSSSAQAAFST